MRNRLKDVRRYKTQRSKQNCETSVKCKIHARFYNNQSKLNYNYKVRKSIAHCVKRVRILSFYGPYFPAFGYTSYLSVFSPNAGKNEPEKLRIRTLFTQ